MSYAVKEMFYTLQGEGARTGRPAVFVRFSGCNLWSGREEDRARAVCRFCDTEFVGTDGDGGGKFESAEALAEAAAGLWASDPPPPCGEGAGGGGRPGGTATAPFAVPPARPPSPCPLPRKGGEGLPYLVCTGGEPLLQLDAPLIDAFHAQGFEIAVETNGTIAAPAGLDWVCVSPKANANLVQSSGDELKLVFPQQGAEPERYEGLCFSHFFLQPMDSPEREANTRAAIAHCLANPQWRLSLQTHKVLGLR